MSERMRRPAPDNGLRATGRTDQAVGDRRRLRGAESRQAITRHAVDLASLEGLNGLSLGRLATDLGISKSGIQTLFRTRENLHLAVIETAERLFADAVVLPALDAAAGTARLRALVEHWIGYAEAPLFPGGCFWAANLADFDSRPGPVRDRLAHQHQGWVALLAEELRQAVDSGEVADLDVELAAFQIDAVLMAANTALRLGDRDAAGKVRRVVGELLRSR
ncbi:DNA-binding transcriptional regulator, AcrR family [Thermomonospora echinospora]|uniref:DNA-binding transcriptional regulator, AcrR family n=1 Tax=Thermomonospora echinospora TaxID=1992 RepID=A0A1H6CBI6_9ACTN|nr:TetR/AcrR family transcriptional regulator [Thermomonospora echinospora]SEG70025.1 DNA-binding transcriptional regulator, AcrR family [Thermomonospora echinospora]